MAATGLLTILAILISGYGLLPDEKRLDIRLRISWVDMVMVSVPIVAILVVIYSPVILSFGYIRPVDWQWGFTEDTMVFSCLTAIILFFGYKLLGSSLPAANYTRWAQDSEQYLRSKKFEQLGYLLNKYHKQLFNVIDSQVWYMRVRNYLRPKRVIRLPLSDEDSPKYLFCLNAARELLAKPFPDRCEKQDVIELSVSRILKSRAFVIFLAETYPLVAARASRIYFRDNDEFVKSFFEALISHPGGPLYRELRDNQSCSYTGEYFLDESNPLLNFYLKDIAIAEKVNISKPVGDYVVEYIKKQRGKDNFYNRPDDNFSYEDEKWASPIFVGVVFFEVMVSLAIFQRTNDHMWLMYVDFFLEEILESLDLADGVEKGGEFPSKFNYLMYRIFSACNGWVGAAEHLDYEGVPAANIQHFPEYWAAKTLGSMLRKIITSEKLLDAKKVYFLEIAVKRMKSLDQKGLGSYSKTIFDHIIREYEHATVDDTVVENLQGLYGQVDHVLRFGDSTFEIEMSRHLTVV